MSSGWGWPAGAKKRHYFVGRESQSLCRNWLYWRAVIDTDHKSPANCRVCMRQREKLKAEEEA